MGTVDDGVGKTLRVVYKKSSTLAKSLLGRFNRHYPIFDQRCLLGRWPSKLGAKFGSTKAKDQQIARKCPDLL